MLFAHLKRILRLDRLPLPRPNGARDEFLLAATAQNLRRFAKLSPPRRRSRPPEPAQAYSPSAAITSASVRSSQTPTSSTK